MALDGKKNHSLLSHSAHKTSKYHKQESSPSLFNPEDKRDIKLTVSRASRQLQKNKADKVFFTQNRKPFPGKL